MLNRFVQLTILLIISLTCASCAITPFYVEGDYFHPVSLPIPPGYSRIYVYRNSEPWTAMGLSKLFFNGNFIGEFPENTYTEFLLTPGQYAVVSTPWNYYFYFTVEPNKTYYLAFQLETELWSHDLVAENQVVFYDNTRTLLGGFELKSQSSGVIDLAACRYVKAGMRIFYLS
jgi:hypothetical protein